MKLNKSWFARKSGKAKEEKEEKENKYPGVERAQSTNVIDVTTASMSTAD